MRHLVLVFGVVVCLLGASVPARGQSVEVSGLVGYTPPVGLTNRAPELSALDIAGGFTWGLQAGWLLTPRWGVDVLWTDQASALTADTPAGSADFCDPFGFCQGTLSQVELAAGVVVRF